ncbi:MAG: transposase family protein [Oscillibacter sp.]|nr:transposase family protein [Oscillibacter sp.]
MLLCSAEDFTDMEAFGKPRAEWLHQFPELPHGIPDSAAFRRIFERIDLEALA